MKLRMISTIIETDLLLSGEQQKNQSNLTQENGSANFLDKKNKHGGDCGQIWLGFQ